MIKVAMFDTKPYDKTYFEKALPDNIKIKYFTAKLDENTYPLCKGFDVVCAFVNDDLNSEVISGLYDFGVKLIAMRCAGFNNVDVKSCYKKVHVVRVPSYSPEAVAEHAAAMLLTSARRIHKAYNRTRDFNFSLAGLEGFNLSGKTVGVVGTGKIGRAFISIMQGFKCNILAYDKFPSQIDGVTFTDMDTLLSKSDIISLHCPLTEENFHLIDKTAIDKMKKGVVILNTSRGALIDAEDLLVGIKDRKIGAACLDVYEEESDLFFEDKSGHILGDDILARLLSMPNVIITSHQAFLTDEALSSIAQTTIKNITDFFDGKPLENEVCYRCEQFEDCKREKQKKCF